MSSETASSNCKQRDITFVVKSTNPAAEVIHDDIKVDLAKIGLNVTTQFLDAEAYRDAELNGTYNMLFTETWGAPYDPHSYLESWEVPSHVEFSAIQGLSGDVTAEQLLEKIERVQGEMDVNKREDQYRVILNDIHQQAIFYPLYGVRTPYAFNTRLSDFVPSPQTYSYPLDKVTVDEGPKNVSVAPGSGSALFKTVGEIHPHLYAPNALFAQDWVFEGLLRYLGKGKNPGPGLAMDYKEESTGDGTRVTFTLRENVWFHDGEPFNCEAVELNFDHVLSETVRKRHQWFGTTQKLKDWGCDEGKFYVETNETYYPLLQELTYIRPLVIASPNTFHLGLDSDPEKHNSCSKGGFGSKYDELEETVTCMGLSRPVGTGPFKYVDREQISDGADGKIDLKVIFERHERYWDGAPDIERIEVRYYNSTDEVKAALIDGTLDMALGNGPLSAKDLDELRRNHRGKIEVELSDVHQHAALVFNTAREPTNDIEFRKAIIHGIDKEAFIRKEFYGIEKSVDQLLPSSAPYCGVDLTPKWSYDFEKAKLINCPSPNKLSGGAIGGITVAVGFVIALAVAIFYMIRRERSGKPLFKPSPHREMDVGFN